MSSSTVPLALLIIVPASALASALALAPLAGGASGRPTSARADVLPACETAPFREAGTVYYYCSCENGADPSCAPGDDANPGTSPSKPRRSFAGAMERFNTMKAGDTVALCRGGAWKGAPTTIHNTRCTASRTCDLRDYLPSWATSRAARPRITVDDTNVFNMWTPGHDEGYRYWNLDIRDSAAMPSTSAAFYLANDVSDVDICNVNVTGFNLHVHGAGADVGQQRNERLTLRHSTLSNARLDSMLFASSHWVVDSNTFTNNGSASRCQSGTMFCHTLYVQDETVGPRGDANSLETQDIRITNNKMTMDDATPCGSSIIHVAGRNSRMVIENNVLQALAGSTSGCYGLAVGSSGYGITSWSRATSIRRNRISLPGSEIGQIGIELGGAGTVASSASGRSVYPQGAAVPASTVSDNIIVALGRYPVGIMYATNDGDVTSGVVTYNNTIYLPHAASNWGINFSVGSDYVVQNNAVFGPGLTSCFNPVKPPASRVDHNYCRTPEGSRSAASAATLWTNAAEGDFTPVRGGPLHGTGSSTHYSPTAIGTASWTASDPGVARVVPTDIGACPSRPRR